MLGESNGWPIVTDPYCPTVGTTPPDDTQLVVKSGDILPAGNKALVCYYQIPYKSRGPARWSRLGHTGRDQPRHARTSQLPLSKGVGFLPEHSRFAASVYAQVSSWTTAGSLKLTILVEINEVEVEGR